MKDILLVGLGGGLGSMARYFSQRWIAGVLPTTFPLGTFTVNVTGCFLIGLFWGLATKNALHSPAWNLFLMAGFCGGFTTFSAFTLESIGLLRQEKLFLFFFYLAASVVAGLLATYGGMKLSRF